MNKDIIKISETYIRISSIDSLWIVTGDERYSKPYQIYYVSNGHQTHFEFANKDYRDKEYERFKEALTRKRRRK